MNWKVRFKNKVWLTSFIGAIVSFVYMMLGMFEVFPKLTESTVMQVVNAVLMMLTMMGVLIDPTVDGVYDSARAMEYEDPAPNWTEKDFYRQ